MSEERRCSNCMAKMPAEGERCLACGFDNRNVEQPEYALPCNSVLKDRYLMGRILGQGGFGLTYIAWDTILKVKVVVKEYFPMGVVTRGQGMSTAVLWNATQVSAAQRQQGYNSFIREAQKMARVDQIPSIVRVRDTFLENETAYIIMDYVEGCTLKEKLLKEGPMAFSQCMALLRPMIEGLSKVHKQGIIHRDISPDNIMIQPDGSVKLLDLGAAKDMTDVGGPKSQLVAKKGFSPLEQYVENGKIGGWTDVYALCATIYYCITGKLLPAALERMDNEEVVFPPAMKEALPDDVIQALKDGLALRPEKRIQSAEELLQRLDAEGQKVPGGSAADPAPKKKSSRKKRALGFAGGFLAVCIVGFIALAALGSSGRTAKRLGNSNANLANGGGYAAIDKKYLYFTGMDDGLYISAYNTAEGVFETESAEKVFQNGKYINVGKDAVYFVGKEDGQSAVYQMNPDGTGCKVLISNDEQKGYDRPQYVEYESGREYIYYMLEKEAGGSLKELYRYDVKDGGEELLLDKNISWFNIYEDSLYIIALEDQNSILMRMNLNGRSGEVLDDKNIYESGFVEDGAMFLYSLKKEKTVVCNLDGEEKKSFSSLYQNTDMRAACGYGNDWFYYADQSDGSLRRMHQDGKSDGVVMEDYTAGQICYANDSLWILKDDKEFRQLFLADDAGGSLVNLSGPVRNLEFEVASEEDFTWEEDESGNGVIITGYTGTMQEFTIPSQIDGRQVTEIGEEAFVDGRMLKVGLQEGLVKIGRRAFANCWELDYINIPETVKEIGALALLNANLDAVYIPAGVDTIGYGAFLLRGDEDSDVELEAFEVSEENTRFVSADGVLFQKSEDGTLQMIAYPPARSGSSYSIPEQATELWHYSLGRTALESVEIPPSVQTIYDNAFYGDKQLKSITVSETCSLPSEYGTALRVNFYEGEMEAPEDTAFTFEDTEDGTGIVITGYTGTQTSFSVPEQIEGKPVKEIGERAFENGGAVKIHLPDGLEKIGQLAFFHCQNLEFISLPESLKEIGNMAFLDTNLISVSIPANVSAIGTGAFLLRNDGQENNRFTDFEVSSENAYFEESDGVLCKKMDSGKLSLFAYPQGRADESYTIPDDVAEIGVYSFARSKLTSVEIPSSVRKIDYYAFADCYGLSSIAVSQNCEVLEQQDDSEDKALEITRY